MAQNFYDCETIITELAYTTFASTPEKRYCTYRFSNGIVYRVSGTRLYKIDGKEFLLQPGELLFLPKGTKFYAKNISDGESYTINFFTMHDIDVLPFKIRIKN